MARFYEEVYLNEQPFIKGQTISIRQLIAAKATKLGENIAVRRFARFKVGAATEDNRDRGPEGRDDAGTRVKKPKGPKSGSGLAAGLDERQ
jgi:hypothetical protein